MNNVGRLIQEFDRKQLAIPAEKRHYVVGELLSDYVASVKILTNCVKEITEALNTTAERKDWSHLMYWIVAANYHPSLDYVNPLCKILDYHDVTVPNEQIGRAHV